MEEYPSLIGRPLRILIASQPLTGGVAAHVGGLVEALHREGHRIDVACPRESQVWERVSRLDGVRLHAVGAHRRPAPGDLRSLGVLLRLVGRADVVHAHSSKDGFLARLAAMLTGRSGRCVFTPHGWSFWAADGAESRLYVTLERLAAHWCRAIVAISGPERDAGLAERIGRPELYRVIPNGVDPAVYAARPHPLPGRVLAVRRL